VPKENLIGQTIAGYTLRNEVGEGGTSAVFRAEHPAHGVVAVKVLREKLRQDKTAVARFVREAKYGERVQHPNVVRTIEVGEAGPGLHFLAIEWAKGELLERYVKQNAPLPADEVAAIAGLYDSDEGRLEFFECGRKLCHRMPDGSTPTPALRQGRNQYGAGPGIEARFDPTHGAPWAFVYEGGLFMDAKRRIR